MKIDRLMGIVVYLLNHGRTSAQKLAEEFEVSSRTIMRDLESLDQAGIPIQSFYGAEGGYQLMEDFVLEKQVATNHQYDWILTALEGMEDDKINEQLKQLEKAIEKQCVVRFSYTNSHDEAKEIQVEPVQLQYKWYNWYLIGYYEKYRDYCMFKLVRMDNLEVTDIRNTKIHNPSEIQLNENSDPVIHVKLHGKAIIKSKCREYLNGQITREFENGDFEFTFSVPEHESFWYGVLLSFGNKVKVIEPQELKEQTLRTCKEIQAEYER